MAVPVAGRGDLPPAQPSSGTDLSETLARYLKPGVEWVANFIIRHWLLVTNTMLFVFVALPFLAPVLAALSLELPARMLFLVYRPTCHQLPQRSFFIAGHQVAVCARCNAIYVSFWAVGMAYALAAAILPRRVPVWPAPPVWAVGVAVLPLAVDGLTQLFGFRESTNLLRAITGTLAGGMAAVFVYPYLHSGFRQSRQVWEESRRQAAG